MADDQEPELPAEAMGAVVTADGVVHVGVLPASAAVTVEEKRAARTGWFKSRSGSVMHADGPDQLRALTDLGWDEISEQQAKDIVAAGVQLTVHSDTGGTFDADAVSEAVRNESAGHAARSAAAKKAAATRRRNQAAQEAEARAAANSESDAVTTEG